MDTTYTITRREYKPTDPRLKRHVNHDSRSRRYPISVANPVIQSVRHQRHIPILDQGNLGSCTGNAGIGCMGTGVFYERRGNETSHYVLDETGALRLYSDATNIDPYAGQYPPDDTGSDGLSIAKALKAAGEISGYRHAFGLADALMIACQQPVIVGIDWYEAMFDPDANGLVHPTGGLSGGHEIVLDEVDVPKQLVGFTNSWGESWGKEGRFYLRWADFSSLLQADGDVTAFVPVDEPAPVPTPPVPPTPDVDATFAAAAHAWLQAKGL